MTDKLYLIKEYFSMLERFSADREEFLRVLHPDIIQTEYPNAMTKTVTHRTLDQMLAGAAAGKRLLAEQSLEIGSHFSSGETMIVEATWRGTFAAGAGHWKTGDVLTAHLCMIFEFKEGKIHRQRNYDCYEPL